MLRFFVLIVLSVFANSIVWAQTAADLGPQDAYSQALRNHSDPGGLGPTMADVQEAFERIINQSAPDDSSLRSPREAGPTLKFDQVRNLFCINGYIFDAEDSVSAIQSLRYLEIDPAGCPRGAWTGITADMYAQYIRRVEGIETNYDARIYNTCVVEKSRGTDRTVLGNVRAACREIAASPNLWERIRWGK